jgi:hypothetical protein
MEIFERTLLKYVRGSIEAYLENKRTLNWVKGVIKKSGILEYKNLLREIFDGLAHYRETPRYRELLKESLRMGWLHLKSGILLDIVSWEKWDELLKKAKGQDYQDKNGCVEFYMNNKKESCQKYIGLAYPDRSLSSEKEAVILAEIDTHRAQNELYEEWRRGKITYQDYRNCEEEISAGHTPILNWIKRKYEELKNS